MYTGELKVSTADLIPLLSLANYYAVMPLKEACGEILGTQITGDKWDTMEFLLMMAVYFIC